METIRFEESGIDERIVRAVKEMGFESLSPIQQEAIPAVLNGEDIIAYINIPNVLETPIAKGIDNDYYLNHDLYKNDERFKYIEKPTYKGLEFKTDKSLIYFLDELTTDYYNIK